MENPCFVCAKYRIVYFKLYANNGKVSEANNEATPRPRLAAGGPLHHDFQDSTLQEIALLTPNATMCTVTRHKQQQQRPNNNNNNNSNINYKKFRTFLFSDRQNVRKFNFGHISVSFHQKLHQNRRISSYFRDNLMSEHCFCSLFHVAQLL